MIRWMRKYNEDPRHTPKLQFLGFDMQIARVAVANVEEYLLEVDSKQYRVALSALAPLADESNEYKYRNMPVQFRQQTAAAIKSLLLAFQDRKQEYVAASSERDWIVAEHNLEIVKQAEELYSSKSRGVRDRFMAENVKWILDNEPAGTKAMLWAHNAHVWTMHTREGDSMGRVLRQMYGGEMVVCGFSFYQGSFRAVPQPRLPDHYRETFVVGPAAPNAVESALAATGLSLFAVDLRAAPAGVIGGWVNAPHPMRIIGATYAEYQPTKFFATVPPSTFDVIFFVNQTSPSRENPVLPKQMETDFGRG